MIFYADTVIVRDDIEVRIRMPSTNAILIQQARVVVFSLFIVVRCIDCREST